MIDDSDYEILPHKELEHLRAEVDKIKKNPLGEKYKGDDLIKSVNNLNDTINHMNDIFTTTNQEMINDYQNNSMQNNFKTISSQNEQIAKAILSVVDLVSKQNEVLSNITDTLEFLKTGGHPHHLNMNNPSPSVNVPKPEGFDKPQMGADNNLNNDVSNNINNTMNNNLNNSDANNNNLNSFENDLNNPMQNNSMQNNQMQSTEMQDPFADNSNQQISNNSMNQNSNSSNMNLPEPPPPRRKLFGGN